MKPKLKKLILPALLLVILAATLTACGLWTTPLKSISFGFSELTVKVGEEVQLNPLVSPSGAQDSIRFLTSNSSVATVSQSGLLKGVGEGQATIAASNNIGNIKDEITVNVVYDPIPEGGLVLSAQHASQLFGATIVAVNFTVDWGTVKVPESAQIKWFQKLGGQSEFTEILEAAGKKDHSLTPPNQMGYSATVQVRVTYGGNTYVSNNLVYGVYDQMRDVRVSYEADDNGLYIESQTYYTHLGDTFTLTLSWHENSNRDPVIIWYIQKDEEPRQTISGQSGVKLTHSIVPEEGAQPSTAIGDYTITASADGVMCDTVYSFYLTATYADVQNAGLSAQGVSGDITITMLDTEDIVFTATWNSNCTDNSKVVIEYYDAPALEEGQTEFDFTLRSTVLATDSDITFTYTPVGAAGVYAVKAIIYNEAGSEEFDEAVALITILEQFNEVKSLALAVSGGQLKQTSGSYQNVTFTATPTPANCLNPATLYEWYVNGELQTGQSGASFTLTSAYLNEHSGQEITVCVKLAGVRSRMLTALAFPNNSYISYLNDEYIWDGDVYNHYISSMDELIVALSHITMLRSSTRHFRFAPQGISGINFTDNSGLANYLSQATQNGYDESGSRSYNYLTTAHNQAAIGWSSGAPLTSSQSYTADFDPEQISWATHYGAHSRSSLPVDNFPTYNVTSSNMLYRVVSWGYRPTFNAETGETAEQTTARQNAQTIYQNARALLLEICNDNMTDTQKAHVIFDWIVCEVDYDTALANASGIPVDDALEYDGFYLEGVFLKAAGEQRKAVCDGKSKAFSLLCAMEGISTYRVIGYIEGDPNRGHAWNKVLLDPDGDGIKNWYIVDTTWSDMARLGNEYLVHSYFLLSDFEISGTHTETRDYYPEADDVEFDYYAYLQFTAPAIMLDAGVDNTASGVVETAEQLAVLLAIAQKCGYTEFRLADGLVLSNLFNDARDLLTNSGGSWQYVSITGSYYCYFWSSGF
jgi:hypothetical protein